jgi:hypothetical protein
MLTGTKEEFLCDTQAKTIEAGSVRNNDNEWRRDWGRKRGRACQRYDSTQLAGDALVWRDGVMIAAFILANEI